MPKSLRLMPLGWLLLVTSGGSGCGDEREPHPGFADPCLTPMAGTLGCPVVTGQATGEESVESTCRKLVLCGILADSFLGSGGQQGCPEDPCDDRPGGQCLSNSSGNLQCFYPHLDLLWCINQLTQPHSNPCDGNQRFTAAHVTQAVQCIAITPCSSLGLPFWQKRLPQDQRPEMDRYLCKDDSKKWTATVCDHGMLAY